MGKAAFTKAAVVRAIEAVREAGFDPDTVEITADGTIRAMKLPPAPVTKGTDRSALKKWAG
ncbi:hypothetical protein [Falsirhodobacter xinxiangensis]|uniref:hypothetical protein n=1 Tax=Falsirhodobacter xinxiangensis TaxID=2530049 RepID=UPI0010AB0660|nr:hypothetical protein [Rhodobacter xinxiangensis]